MVPGKHRLSVCLRLWTDDSGCHGESRYKMCIRDRYKRLYMMGGEVCAVHTSDRVKKILTMSGTAKIMHIYEEEQ